MSSHLVRFAKRARTNVAQSAMDAAMVAATVAAERAAGMVVKHTVRGAGIVAKSLKRKFTGNGNGPVAKRSRATASNPAESSTGLRTTKTKGAGTRKESKKQKKKAKPSKKLRKLVKQIIDPDVALSTLTVRVPHKIATIPALGADNKQSCTSTIPDGAGTAFSDYSAFDSLHILDAASQLFNLKAFNINYGLTTNNFSNENLKCHVKAASFSLDLRNNTQVAKEITLYVCKSRVATDSTALADWVTALAADNANRGAYTVDEYGVTPAPTERWKKLWTYTVEKVMLEPGVKGKLFVQGPQDKWYDFAKLNTGATVSKYNPGFGVSMFVIMRNTEVYGTTTGPQVGIYTQSGNGTTSTHGVSALAKWYYSIYCPELADDANRFRTYLVKFAANGTMTANDALMRIDPLNPSVKMDTALAHGTGSGPVGT